MTALGAVLAATLTREMTDRSRAGQLVVLAGLMPQTALGVVIAASQASGSAGPGTTPGATQVVVPPLEGLDVTDATERLTGLGLVTATASAVAPERIGTVVSAAPAEGTLVAAGSTVTLVVSVGSPVPDLVGLTVDAAVVVLKTAAFGCEVVTVDRDGADPGTVLTQDPAAGSYLEPGDTVVLTTPRAKGGPAVVVEVVRETKTSSRGQGS